MDKLRKKDYMSATEFIDYLVKAKGADYGSIKALKEHSILIDSIKGRDFETFKKYFNENSALVCNSIDFWPDGAPQDYFESADFSINVSDEFLEKAGIYMNSLTFTIYFAIVQLKPDEDFSFFRKVFNLVSERVILPFIEESSKFNNATESKLDNPNRFTIKQSIILEFLKQEVYCLETAEELNNLREKVAKVKYAFRCVINDLDGSLTRAIERDLQDFEFSKNIRNDKPLSEELKYEIMKVIDKYSVLEAMSALRPSSYRNQIEIVSDFVVRRMCKDEDILAINLTEYLISYRFFLQNPDECSFPFCVQKTRFLLICKEIFRKKMKLESNIDLTDSLYELLYNHIRLINQHKSILRDIENQNRGNIKRPRRVPNKATLENIELEARIAIIDRVEKNTDIFSFLEYIKMEENVWKPIYQHELLGKKLNELNTKLENDDFNDQDSLNKI